MISGARLPEAWARLNQLDGRPPGGESLRDVAHRCATYLDTIDGRGPTLVVAHGGVIRSLLGLLDGWSDSADFGARPIRNAQPLVRELELGSWRQVLERLS